MNVTGHYYPAPELIVSVVRDTPEMMFELETGNTTEDLRTADGSRRKRKVFRSIVSSHVQLRTLPMPVGGVMTCHRSRPEQVETPHACTPDVLLQSGENNQARREALKQTQYGSPDPSRAAAQLH